MRLIAKATITGCKADDGSDTAKPGMGFEIGDDDGQVLLDRKFAVADEAAAPVAPACDDPDADALAAAAVKAAEEAAAADAAAAAAAADAAAAAALNAAEEAEAPAPAPKPAGKTSKK